METRQIINSIKQLYISLKNVIIFLHSFFNSTLLLSFFQVNYRFKVGINYSYRVLSSSNDMYNILEIVIKDG